MLFDGKLDAIDLMAIEYEKRREKLLTIVDYVRRSPETNVDISGICQELDIRLTGAELDWIASQVY
jgi:hypothetical protein